MPRRRWGRRLAVGGALAVLVVAAVAAYLLLWGRYSPYSPLVLGFDRAELAHVVVYLEEGAWDGSETAQAAGGGTAGEPDEPGAGEDAATVGLARDPQDLAWVDALLPEVEAAHGLRFKSRPRVLFFRQPDTYARRTTTRARACAYFNGTIVVSPWVQEEDAEGVLSLEVYLRHELSHALLYQRMGLLAALSYPKWLLEGVATWSAGQMGTATYPDRGETRALIAAGQWMPPEVYGTPGEDDVRLEVDERMTFMYCEFACVVDDLVARYGRATFFGYVRTLMDDGDHDAVFHRAFGIGFRDYLRDFRARAGDEAL